MANVTIDIASEFRGKAAFDKAGKSVGGLEKAVGKLGKQLAGVFAAQKIYAFGKASVKAFEEDQKSAALLANTMKNLGLQFANPEIETFIGKLSRAAGVADDQLRPAMQTLLTTTGSLAGSQKLLAQAIDISRGSGVELATVVQDLNNAFVGNTKGLKKYNLGLTQAELKATSFTDIQTKLNAQFSGSSAAYLATYAGKMDILNTAAGEAKETIGKGLVDSLTILAGKQGDVQGVADAMGNIATQAADVTTGISLMIGELKKIPGAGLLSQAFSAAVKTSGLAVLFNAAKKKANQAKSSALAPASANQFLNDHMATANAAKAAKAEADAKKRAQAILKAQQANTKALKEQSLVKKQSALFDLQQIELVAALKGKLSEEDRNRVLLQLALLQGNEEEASRLSTQIANSIDKTGNLAKYLQTLPDANNPFKNWQSYLDAIEEQVKRITSAGVSTYAGGGAANGSGYTGSYDFYSNPATGGSVLDNYRPSSSSSSTDVVPPVVIQIDGKTIAATLMDQSLSGNQTYINRRTGGFDF
jgi:hypothetical protein